MTDEMIDVLLDTMLSRGLNANAEDVRKVIAALEEIGYAIVPMVPTEEMVEARFNKAIYGQKEMWRAMLDAAPSVKKDGQT